MSTQHRQGDVMTIERDDLTIEQLREGQLISKDECVLAAGELTGHAHRILETPRGSESVEMFMVDGVRMVWVPASFGPVKIQHEEHNAIELAPGKVHEIRIQREFDGVMARNVAD